MTTTPIPDFEELRRLARDIPPAPTGLSPEERLVWLLGDLMNAAENYFGAPNPKRAGHIYHSAIRIMDEVLAPLAAERESERETLAREKAELEEKVRVLSEALKPFADLGREFGDEHWKDDEVVLGHEVRDHRRAARAISPEPIGASNAA